MCVHICVLFDMSVEWDESKRLANLEDHGVDFQDAALIILGPVIQAEDTRSEYGERRFRALGHVDAIAMCWSGSVHREKAI